MWSDMSPGDVTDQYNIYCFCVLEDRSSVWNNKDYKGSKYGWSDFRVLWVSFILPLCSHFRRRFEQTIISTHPFLLFDIMFINSMGCTLM